MILNPFSTSGLFLSIICFILLFIILRAAKTATHYVWGLFNLSVAVWGLGSFFMRKDVTPETALLWIKIAHAGVIFIAIFFFHLVYLICDLSNRKIIVAAYTQGVILLFLLATNLFISPDYINIVFDSFYYDKAHGYIYPFFFAAWAWLISYGHYKLFRTYQKSHGFKRQQILYLFLGMAVGFSGGITNFLPVFNIPIYPIGNFTIPIYCLIVTYAILRYHILDIRIAITRAGIFAFVYLFVLGLPILMGRSLHNTDIWYIPLLLGLVLATLGPIIYNYLRGRAEAIILKEQKDYQEALSEFGRSLKEIKKEKDKLLKLVANTVKEKVTPAYVTVYTYHKGKKEYSLYCRYPEDPNTKIIPAPQEGSLVKALKQAEGPIVSDDTEIDILHQHKLLVPIFVRGGLFGFLVLGPKPGKRMYTPDDINAFNLLSINISLAMENCLFWEQESTNERLRRMKSLDVFSGAMAHEIKNPLCAVDMYIKELIYALEGGPIYKSNISELEVDVDALWNNLVENGYLNKEGVIMEKFRRLKEYSEMNLDYCYDSKKKEIFAIVRNAQETDIAKAVPGEIKKYFLTTLKLIIDNSGRAVHIINTVREYSLGKTDVFSVVNMDDVLEGIHTMLTPFFKKEGVEFIEEVERDIRIWGNKTALQQVLMNLGVNAIHAVGLNETGNRKIWFKLYKKDTETFMMEMRDNGYGIKKEANFQEDIFLDFVTTKGSVEGSGMGLSISRKIVEAHKGRIWAESEGEGKGATFFIELPIANK